MFLLDLKIFKAFNTFYKVKNFKNLVILSISRVHLRKLFVFFLIHFGEFCCINATKLISSHEYACLIGMLA